MTGRGTTFSSAFSDSRDLWIISSAETLRGKRNITSKIAIVQANPSPLIHIGRRQLLRIGRKEIEIRPKMDRGVSFSAKPRNLARKWFRSSAEGGNFSWTR